MKEEKNLQESKINEDFDTHLKSLREKYDQSTLKEKHKLNEHIKHILQKHSDHDTKAIEEDIG